MLTLTFDMAFDHGHWPGPLAGRRAAAGDLWVGPLGLLTLLETMTGRRGPATPRAVRVASLVPAIRAARGFWSQSAEVDPFGTADKILQWRDDLWLHGWRGDTGCGRLPDLGAITAAALPGLPDRLLAVEQALLAANNTITSLRLLEPPTDLPLAWRQIFAALEKAGTSVTVTDIPPAEPAGDLAACRRAPFAPAGDGSLQLLRPLTPGAAAQEAAAWLAGLDSLERAVIIGPDSTLDRALHRLGLPTTGAGIPVYDNSLLQVLPLVLEMAWSPPDPQRALELLILPVSPIPRGIAFRLIRALQKYPAVGSEAWHQALADGLEAIADPGQARQLQDRLTAIFDTPIPGSQYPRTELLARIDLLRAWVRGRQASQDGAALDWQPLVAQIENAQRMVSLSGLEQFTAPQIRRLIHDLTADSDTTPLYPDQAGLARVGAPECLAGPADHILWWSFSREAAQPVHIDPFSPAERQSLRENGILLPDPGAQAVRNAARWQRPLLLAENQLVLACPENSGANEEQFPHPLWDELVGRLQKGAAAAPLESRQINDPRKPAAAKHERIALPAPATQVQIDPALLPEPETASPNSLSALLACPFRWVAGYPGQLSGGLAAALAAPEELEGWFIHEILSRLLKQGPQPPDTAAQKAADLFDTQGPFLAARYFLPGHDDLRSRVRINTQTAAARIYRLIDQGGFAIAAVEEPLEQSVRVLGVKLTGRPDLVLSSPTAVIDFKRGGVSFRRDEIASGTSVQLAVYGHLLRGSEGNPFPPAAYYMLKAGQLLTADPDTFPEAVAIEGVPLAETWQALTATYKEIRADLDNGHVPVTGNQPDAPDKSALIEDRLCLAPCAFCDLSVCCGKAFAENGIVTSPGT